jgi:branched-chain amino acid transport system substrate-binding protein
MKSLLALATAAALSITASAAQADVNIGVILSLTGPGASLGIPARNTVDLWPKEIGGQKVNVTILDDASDPGAATTARGSSRASRRWT